MECKYEKVVILTNQTIKNCFFENCKILLLSQDDACTLDHNNLISSPIKMIGDTNIVTGCHIRHEIGTVPAIHLLSDQFPEATLDEYLEILQLAHKLMISPEKSITPVRLANRFDLDT